MTQVVQPYVSVVLPCRNEEEALGDCITRIQTVFKRHQIDGEVIVSDSSSDDSPEIARRHGAILVKHDKPGYGRAYIEGTRNARGSVYIFADADGTYDFDQIPTFLRLVEEGSDLVIGNRFRGTIEPGAMPFLHRWIGNPVLSFILNVFFNTTAGDAHCGMRALTGDVWSRLKLRSEGMEFASEMLIAASRSKLNVSEIPVNYFRRRGKSKLNTFSDGWRHLRLMLLYSPLHLFIIPGIVCFIVGAVLTALLYFNKLELFGRHFHFHPMFPTALLMNFGYEIIWLGIFAKIFSKSFLPHGGIVTSTIGKIMTPSRTLATGWLTLAAGLSIFLFIFIRWAKDDYGELMEIKNSIIGLTLTILGLQTIFSALFSSLFELSNVAVDRKVVES